MDQFFALFLNQTIVSADLTNILINEVMYDPETNDHYNEWIEFFGELKDAPGDSAKQ